VAASVTPLDEFRLSPRAARFEGGSRGVPASFFVTDHPPGSGPDLHTHPYPEVFIVEDGVATFSHGEEKTVVEAGNVVIVPAETPHGFKNSGEGNLHIVSIHPQGEMVQVDL
jgi:quercetin dioxygenase-like cupin family protein